MPLFPRRGILLSGREGLRDLGDEKEEDDGGMPGRVIQSLMENHGVDILHQQAAVIEEADRRAFRVPGGARPHNNRLRAEVVRQGGLGVTAMHLLQTDNDVQPVMGAVHLVQPSADYNDKHFMHDVEGDINEGQKVLVERARRGPFRKHGGLSTVMDRSAHVTYRKRSGAFEITVRRGAVGAEIKLLMSKLSTHRMSVHGSNVVIIKGSKRYRLGALADINMQYLQELITECLQEYGTCGLEITEVRAGRGALYRDAAHSARTKGRARA